MDGRAAPLGPDDLKILGNLCILVFCLLVAAVLSVQGLLYACVEETKMRNLLWAVLYRTCVTQQVHSQRQCVQRFAAALDIDTTGRGPPAQRMIRVDMYGHARICVLQMSRPCLQRVYACLRRVYSVVRVSRSESTRVAP